MDNQIMRITLIIMIPPRKIVSLADCTLLLVVLRTLNHFSVISRNILENILRDYLQGHMYDENHFLKDINCVFDIRCYIIGQIIFRLVINLFQITFVVYILMRTYWTHCLQLRNPSGIIENETGNSN